MQGASLDEITDGSALIVVGVVRSFRGCLESGTNSIVTEVVLTPEGYLKAPAAAPSPGADVTIDVPGGRFADFVLGVGTSPQFSADERVTVFLHDVSGRLQVTEGFQGKFSVTPTGLVAPLGVPLDRFEAKIRQAIDGTLSPSADPLAAAEGQIVESPYVTFASWAIVDIPVPYFINSTTNRPAQLTAAQTETALNSGFGTWQNDPQSYIAFWFSGNTTRVSGAEGCPDPEDKNDLTWGIAGTHDANTLAVTYTCYNGITGKIYDADIEFDTDHFGTLWRVDGSGSCGEGVFDLETAALHEEGHFLGLGHPSFNTCVNGTNGDCPVMDGTYGGVQRALCADDINGVRALYPGSTPPVVGGIAELPPLAAASVEEAGAPAGGSGWSAGGYGALAGGLAAAAVAIAAGGWHARRRWLR